MGQRCDMRMTRARLIGACVTVLLVITTVIGTLAFVAVRHYRAVLIQAKVDQTRSRYARHSGIYISSHTFINSQTLECFNGHFSTVV